MESAVTVKSLPEKMCTIVHNEGQARELAKVEPEKTQQAIAEHVGCSQKYVSVIQGELRSSSKLSIPATRKGMKNGGKPKPAAVVVC